MNPATTNAEIASSVSAVDPHGFRMVTTDEFRMWQVFRGTELLGAGVALADHDQ